MTALARPDQVKSVGTYIAAWENTRALGLEIFERLDDATFKAPPPEGGWSASQIAEHLYLTQISFAVSIPAVLAGKFGYDASTMPPRNYAVIEGNLDGPKGFKNPAGVGPQGGWDKEKAFSSLKKSMDRMKRNLADKSPGDLITKGMDHPLAGPVTLLDWLWILTMHEAAHLVAVVRKYG